MGVQAASSHVKQVNWLLTFFPCCSNQILPTDSTPHRCHTKQVDECCSPFLFAPSGHEEWNSPWGCNGLIWDLSCACIALGCLDRGDCAWQHEGSPWWCWPQSPLRASCWESKIWFLCIFCCLLFFDKSSLPKLWYLHDINVFLSLCRLVIASGNQLANSCTSYCYTRCDVQCTKIWGRVCSWWLTLILMIKKLLLDKKMQDRCRDIKSKGEFS